MKKLVGYIVAIAGLVIMAIGLGSLKLDLWFLKGVGNWYLSVIGGALIAAGVLMALMDKGRGSRGQAEKEVPIYEGTGKHRKIVGYQRAGG